MSSERKNNEKVFTGGVSGIHASKDVVNLVLWVMSYLKKPDKLLDVGTGTGTMLKDFTNYVNEVISAAPT